MRAFAKRTPRSMPDHKAWEAHIYCENVGCVELVGHSVGPTREAAEAAAWLTYRRALPPADAGLREAAEEVIAGADLRNAHISDDQPQQWSDGVKRMERGVIALRAALAALPPKGGEVTKDA